MRDGERHLLDVDADFGMLLLEPANQLCGDVTFAPRAPERQLLLVARAATAGKRPGGARERGNRLSITPVTPAEWKFISERMM